MIHSTKNPLHEKSLPATSESPPSPPPAPAEPPPRSTPRKIPPSYVRQPPLSSSGAAQTAPPLDPSLGKSGTGETAEGLSNLHVLALCGVEPAIEMLILRFKQDRDVRKYVKLGLRCRCALTAGAVTADGPATDGTGPTGPGAVPGKDGLNTVAGGPGGLNLQDRHVDRVALDDMFYQINVFPKEDETGKECSPR